MSLGSKLKKQREAKGISQEEVAKSLNLTRQSISKWENDKGYPDIENLVLLSEFYQVSLDELMRKDTQIKEDVANGSAEATAALEGDKAKQAESKEQKDEGVLLLILAIVSCLIPFLGTIIPIYILIKKRGTSTHRILIKLVCVCCVLVSIMNSFVILNDMFFHFGTSTVEFLG